MNNFLKPIDTVYKGYKFRSRLEARWAVFFDEMRFKWEYEPQGFGLSNGDAYLPDFKIHGIDKMTWWYEIKPLGDKGDGKMEQFEKDFRFANPEDLSTFFSVLSGDPWEVLDSGINVCPRCGAFDKQQFHFYDDDRTFQYQCYPCDYHTPCGGGNPVDTSGIVPCRPHKGDLMIQEKDYLLYKEIVLYAAKKARSARFEHKV